MMNFKFSHANRMAGVFSTSKNEKYTQEMKNYHVAE